MIVKGTIINIDYNTNTCQVRLPVFESAANGDTKIITTATFCVVPGSYNNYVINDVVYVGFENDLIENAVILGKLFLSTGDTKNDSRSEVVNDTISLKEYAKIAYVDQQINNLPHCMPTNPVGTYILEATVSEDPVTHEKAVNYNWVIKQQ